jgi:hypothetical protein
MLLKEIHKKRTEVKSEEEKVLNCCWMTLEKREDNENWKRKLEIKENHLNSQRCQVSHITESLF